MLKKKPNKVCKIILTEVVLFLKNNLEEVAEILRHFPVKYTVSGGWCFGDVKLADKTKIILIIIMSDLVK